MDHPGEEVAPSKERGSFLIVMTQQSPKLKKAIEVKRHALSLVNEYGKFEDMPNASPHLNWRGDKLDILLRTPFQKTPEPPPLYHAHVGRLPNNLPYGLDIWVSGGSKVFNIEWSDDGSVKLVSFKRGDWENELFEIAECL